MKFDFDQIRRDNPLPDVVSQSGVAIAKEGREFRACCPFHGEKTPSFCIYPTKGDGSWKYHCFGCGATGDVIDFVRERYGYDNNGDAARYLTGEEKRAPVPTAEYKEAHDPYAGYEIIKPPADAPEIIPGVRSKPVLNPKRINEATKAPKLVSYTPSAVYPYRTRTGALIGYVLRVEFDNKKITPGVWWTKNERTGFEGWAHGSYPSPGPLYGLDQLYASPGHQVLLVEGEKCKDAACAYMEGKRVVPVTWMGGGKSIEKTYWKSLAGRSVIIWPDNDAEGWKTTMGFSRPGGGWKKGLIELLFLAGVSRIQVVKINPAGRKEGWDIADALYEDKLAAADVSLLIRNHLVEWTPQSFDDWKQQQIEKEMPHGAHDVGDDELESNAPVQKDQTRADEGRREGEGKKHDAPQLADMAPSNGPGSPSSDHGADHVEQADDNEPPQSNEVAERPTGRGYEIDEASWRSHLIMKADGDGLKSNSLQNFTLILQYEKRFAGIYAWNEFAKEVYLLRRPPWDATGKPWKDRAVTEPDITATASWMEYCGMSPKVSDIGRVIVRVADHNKYNPVVDAIAKLKWDGVKRLDKWLSYYLGADPTQANEWFGRRWMIGAIARAMEPGCKMDNMLILEGAQDLQKSTALRILSDGLVKGVFTDEMSDPNSKDAALQMQGAWIIEIAELDSLRRAEINQIKAWLTRQNDRMRRPYGKVVEEFPRSCVFAGTVNPVGNSGYLKDPTGGRRFWPVLCHAIDIETLKKDAKQLWAEAAELYRGREQWWLTKDEAKIAFGVQMDRYEDDPYGELIDNFLATHTTTTMNAVMEMLEIPKERRSTIAARRIEAHLSMRHWEKIREDGRTFFAKAKAEVLV